MYPCFFIEQIAIAQRALIVTEDGTCPNFSCHRIEVRLDEFKWPLEIELNETCHIDPQDPSYPWPTHCACGYELTDKQSRSSMVGRKWIRKDTGETHLHIHNFGIGAMWYATWWKGKKSEDGPQLYGWDWDDQTTPPLCVQTPGRNVEHGRQSFKLHDERRQTTPLLGTSW
jgi:hypothetical protein